MKECDAEVAAHGIDRVDSDKGYFVDNCVSCCMWCNSMKSDLPVGEWLEHVMKITAHQSQSVDLQQDASSVFGRGRW